MVVTLGLFWAGGVTALAAGQKEAAGAGGPIAEMKAGTIRKNPIDGALMVYVPAGSFEMGSDAKPEVERNPRHTVQLSGYWIYKDVVTVAQYKRFCAATRYRMPPEPDFDAHYWSRNDHPMLELTWYDALAYALWAHADLPTEAQWEKAARWSEKLKRSLRYPWGDNWDPRKLWCSRVRKGDAGGTHKVGELAVSPYGCTDMAGNVWQWCKDYFAADYWKTDRGPDPQGPASGNEGRCLRGGSWFRTDPTHFLSGLRSSDVPTEWDGNFDVRPVIPAEARGDR